MLYLLTPVVEEMNPYSTHVSSWSSKTFPSILMMPESSCLEVDVNGQEIFLVNKDVLTPYSGRLRKLFSRTMMSRINTRKLKVVFRDFPGGAEGFELMSRFCYNNGRVEITPHNIVLLHRVADFMEMEEGYMKSNLRYQTANALRGISFWSWSELLVALRQCQSLLDPGNPSSFVEEIMDCLIWRLSSRNISSPCTTSTDSSHSSCTCSSDSCSVSGLKSNCSMGRRPWWFQELLFLDINWIYKITHLTIVKKRSLDVLGQFLYYYLRSPSVDTPAADRGKIVEAIITVSSVTGVKSDFIPSCRYLFDVHRVVIRLGVGRKHAALLEKVIGSKLDAATIDQLLIRAPRGEVSAYDTSFVIRLCKAFLSQYSNRKNQDRLEKVGHLIDSYTYEVAPDPNLSPSQFLELVTTLPAAARGSRDRIYQAIEMFCEVHSNASEEVCKVLTLLEEQPLIELEEDLAQKSKLKARAILARQYQGKISRRKRLTRSLDLNC